MPQTPYFPERAYLHANKNWVSLGILRGLTWRAFLFASICTILHANRKSRLTRYFTGSDGFDPLIFSYLHYLHDRTDAH